jgi:gliding motility-associated-like protein
MRLDKSLIIIFFLVIAFFKSSTASHIVGAELYYECLGNDNYRITLKYYRDCYCSNCANYGNPEYINIFDVNGYLINQVGMPLPPVNPVNPPINNNCLIPPNVCVEEAIYTTVVNLPPVPGGYDIVYQRCCRNNTINNIFLDAGSTYITHIPGTESFPCNNAAYFKNFPPIFICVNATLVFDHSAIDIDGDSLSYELITPFDGGTPNCPDPSPGAGGTGCPTQPPPPPYAPILWIGTFSATNPLNNPSNVNNLKIDPVSGVLTGIPNQVGQYVVGVAVNEYRNGVLISTTIRDFQFNVTQCNIPITNIPSNNINPISGIGTFTINCDGYTVNFTNNTYNPPPTSNPIFYGWDFGVLGITTDTSSAINPIYTYPDSGTFTVRLTATKDFNSDFCADTAYAIVKIYPGFDADFNFTPQCVAAPVTFSDNSYIRYGSISSWRWNFGDGTTSTFQNPIKTYNTPGTYDVRLVVTSDKGCVDTMIKSITIYPAVSANFTATPSVCVFDTILITNNSSGNISGYSWDFGNAANSTSPNPTNIIYNTPGTKQIVLTVTSPDGCIDVQSRNVVVNPLPIVDLGADTIICTNASIQLNAPIGNSYSWSPANIMSNPSIANPVATPTSPTIVSVQVTSSNGCKNQDLFFIDFFPLPNIDAGTDTSICLSAGSFRDSVMLQASGGASYSWTPVSGLSNSNIANPVSRPITNTTYIVTGTDSRGCTAIDSVRVYFLDPSLNLIAEDIAAICERDTVSLTVLQQGNGIYSWTPATGLSNPTSNAPLFFPLDTTNYIFTIQNYCYVKSDTVTIIVHPLPSINSSKIDSVCIGNSVQINASGADVYNWDFNLTLSDTTIANPIASPITTTTYYVSGTDQFGCSNSDSVVVIVYLPPTPFIVPDTQYICQGQPIQLIASGGVRYAWSNNVSLSRLDVGNPIAVPLDTTTYYVTVTNIHNCSATDSITVNVQLPVNADAATPFDLCEGRSVQLSSSGGFYYQWVPPVFLSNANVSDPVANPNSSIVYTVIVSNDCFSDSAQVAITIRPTPIVDAGRDTLIYRNTEGILQGTTNVTRYFWLPNAEISSATDLNAAVSPLFDRVYTLYVESEYGCTNFDSVTIFVEGKTQIFIPTAFSPNGDGINDVFRVVPPTLNIETLNEFAVFNRWGEKVFSTTDISQGWDGFYKGKAQGLSVYVWYFDAVTYDKESVFRKGNVTLVR